MIAPTLKKTLSDFSSRWSRTILTLGGLVIGIAGVIGVSSCLIILSNDLTENYTRTNPHNVEGIVGTLTAEQLARLPNIPGVAEVEERRRVSTRIEIREGLWFPATLFVVEDFDNVRIDKFEPESGQWPARENEILIERDGRFFLQAALGTVLNVRLPTGETTTLDYVGQVHDAGQAPSRMERQIYGYITRETYNAWSLPDQKTRVLMTIDEAVVGQSAAAAGPHGVAPDAPDVYAANHLAPVMEYMEVEFVSAAVNDTTQHPHEFQMKSIVSLFSGLLITALVLCGALSVNLIDSILTAEVRNIGIMKALGARSGKIFRSYLLSMGLLGGIAALIGLSFSLNIGRQTAQFVSSILNFELLTQSNPLWLAPAVVGLSLVIPLTLAAWRVNQAIKKPVREALQNDDHIEQDGGQLLASKIVRWMPLLPRTALRNLFRSPRRSLLTVILVVIGMVSFLMAANIRSSLLDTVDAVKRSQLSNVQAYFKDPVVPAEMSDWLSRYNEIDRLEFRNARSSRLLEVGSFVGRSQLVSFLPAENTMLNPDLMAGEWIDQDRPAGIVVSNLIYLESDDVEIGSVFDLEVDGNRVAVTVIGVIKEFGGGAIYAPESLANELGIDMQTRNGVFIRLRNQSPQTQARFSRQLEADLIAAGNNMSAVRTTSNLELVVEGHLDIIARVLEIVAAVMLTVSFLGLASATSVNVIERNRETGVLKAIGGSSGTVRRIFVWESVFIAIAGWGVAILLAPIPSKFVSTVFGMVIVQYPFNYEASYWAMPGALLVGLVIAIVASWVPAHTATRKSIRAAVQSV